MKYVVFLGDGMADYPIPELGNKTPLQVADTPNMDALALKGCSGRLQTIPDGMPTGSAVANLAVLGYDPRSCFEGRGVLEAASMGVDVGPDDVAMRCNLICAEKGKIRSHSAGHISSEEASELIDALNRELGNDRVRFHAGVSYRHLLVIKGISKEVSCHAPHDELDTPLADIMVTGDPDTAELLNNLILKSNEILQNHPINVARAKAGKQLANYVWPWSPGNRPEMKPFPIKGAVISAVDLIHGIGVYAGMTVVTVPGATGLHDTNYEGKAQATLDSLKDHDFVFCHVEASDEAGHEGNVELKIKTIEYLDKRLIGAVLKDAPADVAFAVLPDHFTPCALRTHTADPVPFIISRPDTMPDGVSQYDEFSCADGSYGLLFTSEFMELFLRGEAAEHSVPEIRTT